MRWLPTSPSTWAAHVVAVEAMDVPAVEQRVRRWQSRLLVAVRAQPAFEHLRRGRLAQIVAQGAQHHRERPRRVEALEQRDGLVHRQQGVGPNVAFGVPLGVLGRRDEGNQLGRHRGQQSPLAQEREADRGRRALSSSFWISPKTRSAGSSARGIDAHRRAVAGSTVSSKRAASWTARSARSGSSPSVAGSTARRIRRSRSRRPSKGSTKACAEGIEHHGVDREVAAAGRLLEAQVGIARHRDAAMPRPHLRVATRKRDVHGAVRALEAADLEDGERLADGVDASGAGEHFLEMREGQAEDLDVEILGRPAEERVAYGAADEVGPPPGVPSASRRRRTPEGTSGPTNGIVARVAAPRRCAALPHRG